MLITTRLFIYLADFGANASDAAMIITDKKTGRFEKDSCECHMQQIAERLNKIDGYSLFRKIEGNSFEYTALVLILISSRY